MTTIIDHLINTRSTRSMRSLHRSPSRRGQASVEMALLLPLLLLLLFGLIMSGFMFYAYIQVSNAAREGARAGSVYRITSPTDGLTLDQTVRKAVYDPGPPAQSALGFLAPTGSSFNVNADVTTLYATADATRCSISLPCPGDRLTVKVKYRYTLPIISAALPMFPQPFLMERDVMMEIQ